VAVTRGASVIAARARAQSVADAVALAAVTHGVDTARRVAHISHSTVVDITVDGMFVEVTVRTNGTTATAAAVRAVDPTPPG
jgi:Flp pilus assembly protein TadG